MKKIVLIFMILLSPSSFAGESVSQKELTQAIKAGKARPLNEIQNLVKSKIEGEIIDIEVEYHKGHIIYEFKIIDKKGRRRDIYVSALTGEILREKEQ
jgi:uncharacterized membrane protein YkoI